MNTTRNPEAPTLPIRRAEQGAGLLKWVFRMPDGLKITIERTKGIDDETIRSTAEGLLAQAVPTEHVFQVKDSTITAEASSEPHSTSVGSIA